MGSRDELLNEAVEYYDRLFYLALARVSSPDLAEDLVQETLIKAARAHTSFKGDSSLYTWLVSILINLCRDHFRKNARSAVFSDIQDVEVGDVREKTEKKIERKEVVDRLMNMIDELDEKYRDVVILRYFQEMTYREIAESLNLAEGTVKSRLSQARMILHKRLEGAGYKGEDIAML